MRDNGLNDRFAFGSKKSILRWANRIDDRFEYEKEFHSEKYLNWVINKYNIHNYFMNMKAYRIRANGEKHHGDINYLNLKINNYLDLHKNKDIYVIGSGNSCDYIDPSFFNNKITIGINHVYKKFNCTYYIRKENQFLEEIINSIDKNSKLFLTKERMVD